MLYLEYTDRYANMTALMCLVTIEMADNTRLTINNRHLLTLCQSDAFVAFLPRGR